MKGLWSRIDPTSLRDNLCFFYLYPERAQGEQTQAKVKKLLEFSSSKDLNLLVQSCISALIDQPAERNAQAPVWNEETLLSIEQLSKEKLVPKSNYAQVRSLEDLLKVDSKEWDISTVAWLASDYFSSEGQKAKQDSKAIRQYYAQIDLLALSALFAIEEEPEFKHHLPQTKIEKINQIIFKEQGFAFPPLLDHQSQIDKYTSVPSMLSSKKGVCLGVSVLYLAVAQRLGLSLDIVTPPGHIYLTYSLGGENKRNIETTASGMNLPEEVYKPLQSHMLVCRELKELPGLILMNNASVLLRQQKFAEAARLYDEVLKFMNPSKSFFIQELAMLSGWLSSRPGSQSVAKKLWQEYQKDNAERISWDPLLLEEIVKGVVGPEPVRLTLSDSGDSTPSSNLTLLEQLERFSKVYPASKWIKSQMAITSWKLGQEARAFFLWPYGVSDSASFLWTGAQLSMQVGQWDVAFDCMQKLKTKLSSVDLQPLTPYMSAWVSLRQEVVLNEN